MHDRDKVRKAERLRRLERQILSRHIAHWPPLDIKDLAEELGVSVPTIRDDLVALGENGYIPLWVKENRVYVTEGWRVPLLPVILDLAEAAALFLAARLLVRYSDEPNAAVVSALDALADALPPSIARHVRRTSVQQSVSLDPNFTRIFAAVATAWAESRKLIISYRSVESAAAKPYIVHPYYIEPGPIGYSLYLIGYSEHHATVRVFKIERISAAQVSDETFTLAPNFDPLTYLSRAWGVMGPDKLDEELITVRLRFRPEVARRVKESRWHPSQEVRDLSEAEGGGCEMRVKIAETLEMVPWIRGWGNNVEVIEPAALRARIAEEARLTAAIYQQLAIRRKLVGKESGFDSLGGYDKSKSVLRSEQWQSSSTPATHL